MVWVWVGLVAAFLVLEASTAGLVSVWFSAGAAAAALTALIDPDILWLQVLVFVIVSAAALIAIRPLAKKTQKKSTPTNADMNIGREVLVTSDIEPFTVGTVKINGLEWNAVSKNGDSIEKGEIVIIKEISGSKVAVVKK